MQKRATESRGKYFVRLAGFQEENSDIVESEVSFKNLNLKIF